MEQFFHWPSLSGDNKKPKAQLQKTRCWGKHISVWLGKFSRKLLQCGYGLSVDNRGKLDCASVAFGSVCNSQWLVYRQIYTISCSDKNLMPVRKCTEWISVPNLRILTLLLLLWSPRKFVNLDVYVYVSPGPLGAPWYPFLGLPDLTRID